MLLAIDSGNTNVVFAVFDGNKLRGTWRASSDSKRTADEYAVWLTQLMALASLTPADIDDAIVANVVPEALRSLTTLCQRYFGADPMVIGSSSVDLGIDVRMDRPEEVGADRLVNAVAVQARYGVPAVVVDFGTATTFDIIGTDGAYEGGVIAPGINLSIEALYMAAAKLPRIHVRKTDKIIGKATIPGMESGIFWGYIGLIEGLLTRIQSEFGQPMKVVATGGLAQVFAEATDAIEEIDGELTLEGLRLIHERNRQEGGGI